MKMLRVTFYEPGENRGERNIVCDLYFPWDAIEKHGMAHVTGIPPNHTVTWHMFELHVFDPDAPKKSEYEKDCEKDGVNPVPDNVLAEMGYCVNAMCSKHFGGPQDWNCQGKPYPYVNHP